MVFLVTVIALHVVSIVADPPQQLPYLWHLLLALFSFLYNSYFLVVCNLLQLEWLYNIHSNQHHKNN